MQVFVVLSVCSLVSLITDCFFVSNKNVCWIKCIAAIKTDYNVQCLCDKREYWLTAHDNSNPLLMSSRCLLCLEHYCFIFLCCEWRLVCTVPTTIYSVFANYWATVTSDWLLRCMVLTKGEAACEQSSWKCGLRQHITAIIIGNSHNIRWIQPVMLCRCQEP